jgi:hypothetical protein
MFEYTKGVIRSCDEGFSVRTEFDIYVLIFLFFTTIVIYDYFTNNMFEEDMCTLILIEHLFMSILDIH